MMHACMLSLDCIARLAKENIVQASSHCMASALSIKTCGPSSLELLCIQRSWTSATGRILNPLRRAAVRCRTPPTRRLSVMTISAQPSDATDWQQKAPYQSAEAGFDAKYTARCMCGAVQYTVDCDPVAAKYCHCTSCQRLHGEVVPDCMTQRCC